MSFPVALTLIFIVLKLMKVIAWSWLWVLSPLWIGLMLWLAFAALAVFLHGRGL